MPTTDAFSTHGFEQFRQLAQDETLSEYERIGFPDSYRRGYEPAIVADIRAKLTQLDAKGRRVLDIGPGCSSLPLLLMRHCGAHNHVLHLIDSAEMLVHLPDEPFVHKLPALYPHCPEFLEAHRGQFDAILCYSVLHYVFIDVPFFHFLDCTLGLLAPGGQLLIGDIPNISKRKRFFAAESGVRFHRQFTKTDETPLVEFNRIEADLIDDAVIMAILQRARAAGFDAYVVPQHPALPMANRREDILILRP